MIIIVLWAIGFSAGVAALLGSGTNAGVLITAASVMGVTTAGVLYALAVAWPPKRMSLLVLTAGVSSGVAAEQVLAWSY